jgi:osmotically inducible protein OsmC
MSAIQTAKETNRADQPAKIFYAGKAHTTGGRDGGASKTDDGRLDIKLTFPGIPGTGTNPEQLFAAGWSACFLTNLKIAGGKAKVKVSPESTVDAEVDLCSGDDGGFYLQATLTVNLPDLDRKVAQSLIDVAHQNCPYSKATRNNVKVVITLL